MSSDEYEKDQLIKPKSIRMINDETDYAINKNTKNAQTCGLYKCLYQCVVIGLLLAILFTILASFGWYYLSVYSHSLGADNIPLVKSPFGKYDKHGEYGIRLSALPSNTMKVIYRHSGSDITDDEEHILLKIFQKFDKDKDNYWNLHEFKIFIDAAVQPEKNFDRMDLDNNGVVSMKEIYLIIEAFDATDIYECGATDDILYNIFNYEPSDTNRCLFYEYIGQLWLYQLDDEKIGVISKLDYTEYIDTEEWQYHNHNKDEYVDFTEFKNSFFDSLYYQSWKKSTQYLVNDPDDILNIYNYIKTIDPNTISMLQLETTPHQYDTLISTYITSHNNNNNHGPSVSLLYSFPNLYFAQDLVDVSTRRRLGENDCTAELLWYDDTRNCCTPEDHLGCQEDDNDCKHVRKMWRREVTCAKRDPRVKLKFKDCRNSDEDMCKGIHLDGCEYLYSMNGGTYQVRCYRTAAPSPTYGNGDDPDDDPECFDDTGIVKVLNTYNVYEKQLKDVSVGEYVYDGTDYIKVIAVERSNIPMEMIKLYVNNTYITLTDDHLLYNNYGNVTRAGDLKIGDKLYNDLVIHEIEYNLYETSSTPITMSGIIEVNNIKASCYIYSPKFADVAHKVLAPFRFLSEYVNEYISAKIFENAISDSIKLHNSIFCEEQFDLLFIFNIHPCIDVVIVCFGAAVIYGKYLIVLIVSFFT